MGHCCSFYSQRHRVEKKPQDSGIYFPLCPCVRVEKATVSMYSAQRLVAKESSLVSEVLLYLQ